MNIFDKLKGSKSNDFYDLPNLEKPSLRVYNNFEKCWIEFKDLKVISFKPKSENDISDISRCVSGDSNYNFNISENIVVKPKSFELEIVESEDDGKMEIKFGNSKVIKMLEILKLAGNNAFIFEYKDKANKEGIVSVLSNFSYSQEPQDINYFYTRIACTFKEIFDFNLTSDFISSTTSITKVENVNYKAEEKSFFKINSGRNLPDFAIEKALNEAYCINLNLNLNDIYNVKTHFTIDGLSLTFLFQYNDLEDKFYINILSENIAIYSGILIFNNLIPGAFGFSNAPGNLKPTGSFIFSPKSTSKTSKGFITKEDFARKNFNLFFLK